MFKYPPVPLAMGSGLKLRELLGAEFKPAEIRTFLQAWTSGPRYLKAVARGEMRHNLDGSMYQFGREAGNGAGYPHQHTGSAQLRYTQAYASPL